MSKRYLFALALFAAMGSPARAAVLPDPVTVDPATQQRDREREQQRRDTLDSLEAAPAAAPVTGEGAAPGDAQGPAFTLRSVRFSRSDYLGEAQLREVVQRYLGREVRFADLQQLVADVNALYRRQGVFTALAVLPKQQIENGEVLVRLIEGKLGKVVVEGNTFTSTPYILGWMQEQAPASPIDSRRLEADILAFNRSNDPRLLAELRAGESFGLTDIVLRVDEASRQTFQVFVDNHNYESSGREELGLLYRRNQLLLPGDRFSAYGVAAEGMQALSTSWNVPLGHSRWRAGASGSLSRTEVVDGDFAVLQVLGDSWRLNLDASRLLLSRTSWWTTLLLSAGYTDSRTEIAGIGLSEYRNYSVDAGVQLNYLGRQWQLTARQSGRQVQTRDILLDRRNDTVVWRGDLSSVYRFGASRYSVLLQGDWQFTADAALGGEVGYTVGGPASVRGYLPGAVSGDVGFAGSLEGHATVRPGGFGLDTFVFVDHGYVRSLNPEQRLTAAGLGLRTAAWRGFSLDATAGRALEDAVPYQDDWVYYARFTWQTP